MSVVLAEHVLVTGEVLTLRGLCGLTGQLQRAGDAEWEQHLDWREVGAASVTLRNRLGSHLMDHATFAGVSREVTRGPRGFS